MDVHIRGDGTLYCRDRNQFHGVRLINEAVAAASMRKHTGHEQELNTRTQQRLKESIGRGDTLWHDNRVDAALVHYQRAVNIAPNHFESRWKCSQALIALNRLEPAMRQLRCGPCGAYDETARVLHPYLLTLYKLNRIRLPSVTSCCKLAALRADCTTMDKPRPADSRLVLACSRGWRTRAIPQ